MKSNELATMNQEYQRIMQHRIAYWNKRYAIHPFLSNEVSPDSIDPVSPSFTPVRKNRGLMAFLLNLF